VVSNALNTSGVRSAAATLSVSLSDADAAREKRKGGGATGMWFYIGLAFALAARRFSLKADDNN
jgi:hypothetical protein